MDTSSAPLADYFWIAGIDSISYSDPVLGGPNTWEQPVNGAGPPSPKFDATIDEGSEGEIPLSPPNTTSTPRATARHSRNNSWNKLAKVPSSTGDVRNSIQTLEDAGGTESNRSSITIKAPNRHGVRESVIRNSVLGDFDFDRALVKFANERENFLDDLSFRAGAPIHKPAPMTNPRADRIRIEDTAESNGSGRRSPLRSVGGSIRRRISFRDMTSVKRQSSIVHRGSKYALEYAI